METVRFDHNALQRLFRADDGDVAKDLARRAVRVDRAAKQQCPVDTGRLRSSITHELQVDGQGVFGVVGTNVDYAPHVEFGTIHNRAQPYLRPALDAAR